jgi:hypothetical protein
MSSDTPELRTHSELLACTSVNGYMSQSSDPKVPGSRPGGPTLKFQAVALRVARMRLRRKTPAGSGTKRDRDRH